MLNSQGCVVVVVVYPCFCPKGGKFSQRAAQWFSTAPSTAHGARIRIV